MMPGWLSIPAADGATRGSETLPPRPSAARRRPADPGCDPRYPGRGAVRKLLLFVADPALSVASGVQTGASLSAHGVAGLDAEMVALLESRAAGEIEIVDAGTLTPVGIDPGAPMDRHRLDVALSVGRHAAERAKLAGCTGLTCVGLGGGLWTRGYERAWPLGSDGVEGLGLMSLEGASAHLVWRARGRAGVAPERPEALYRTLRRLGRFEMAALVGAMVAGAQMGLVSWPRGSHARVAAWIATGLHPGVSDWLPACEGERPSGPRLAAPDPVALSGRRSARGERESPMEILASP